MGGVPAEAPFEITAQSPAPGDENMWLRQPIDITFSHEVDAETVSAETVKVLAGDEDLAVAVSLLDDERTVRVLLEEIPTAPVELSVSVSSDVASTDGEAIEATEWSVTAPEWVHLPPVDRGDTLLQEFPALATDAEGNVVVAWSERHAEFADRSNLYVSRWTPGGWEHLGERISETGEAWAPKLAVTGEGNPVVSYTDVDSPGPYNETQVFVEAWDGDAWQALGGGLSWVELSGGNATDAWGQDMALDSSGNPVVGWSEFIEGTGVFLLLSRWNGTEWSAPRSVSENLDSVTSNLSALALDGAGRAVVAFQDDAGGNLAEAKHYVTAVPASGSETRFGAPDDTGLVYDMKVVVDGDDRPWVIYRVAAEGGDVLPVKYWDGEAWVAAGEPLNASDDANTPAALPEIVLDGTGAPIVTWAEADSLHLRRWSGTAWEPIGGGVPPMIGDLAIDPFDAPVIAGPTESGVQVVRLNR